MSAEENKAIARRYFEEGHNTRDRRVFEALVEELMAPGYVHHDPFPGTTPDREGVKRMFAPYRDAFPDAEFEASIAGEDGAAVRWTLRGTHEEGEWRGIPPTGRRFEMTGMQGPRPPRADYAPRNRR